MAKYETEGGGGNGGSLSTLRMECVQNQVGVVSSVENFIKEWVFLPSLPGAAVASDQMICFYKWCPQMECLSHCHPKEKHRWNNASFTIALGARRGNKYTTFRSQHQWISVRSQSAVIHIPGAAGHCWASSKTVGDADTSFPSRWAPQATGYHLALKTATTTF